MYGSSYVVTFHIVWIHAFFFWEKRIRIYTQIRSGRQTKGLRTPCLSCLFFPLFHSPILYPLWVSNHRSDQEVSILARRQKARRRWRNLCVDTTVPWVWNKERNSSALTSARARSLCFSERRRRRRTSVSRSWERVTSIHRELLFSSMGAALGLVYAFLFFS